MHGIIHHAATVEQRRYVYWAMLRRERLGKYNLPPLNSSLDITTTNSNLAKGNEDMNLLIKSEE